MDKQILTAQQLAEKLQLNPETIRLWARKGLIPSLHPTPKTLRFELEPVLDALSGSASCHNAGNVQYPNESGDTK